MRCPNCTRQNPQNAKFCESCGTNLISGALQQIETEALEYAGFWRRFVAYIVDTILFGMVGMIIAGIFGGWSDNSSFNKGAAQGYFYLFLITAGWLYFALFESSAQMGTPGKRAVGIVVTDLDLNRISFGRATGRYLSKLISGMIFFIGYLMAGSTPKKQALHDMMAGCLVVTKKSLPQLPHHIAYKRAMETQKDSALSKNRVIMTVTPLYLEANFSAMVTKGLNTGEEIELLGAQESEGSEWVEVKCSDGQTGFITGDTPLLDPNIKWSFVQATVNLYEQPSLQSQIKKQYHKGEKFYQITILKNEDQEWLKIRDVYGDEGFIEGTTKVKE